MLLSRVKLGFFIAYFDYAASVNDKYSSIEEYSNNASVDIKVGYKTLLKSSSNDPQSAPFTKDVSITSFFVGMRTPQSESFVIGSSEAFYLYIFINLV